MEDLPLVANISEVLVRHYHLSLSCDFPSRRLTCSALLHLEPQRPLAPEEDFLIVLDCHRLEVANVEAVVPPGGAVEFVVSEWALRVWGPGPFPSTVRVTYQTVPECPSLMWAWDRDGKPCVFTCGALVNNRSLLPCQEPPVAMATWEAEVLVEPPAMVLMSGEHVPSSTPGVHHFRFDQPLPMSTLALAIGYWEGRAIQSHGPSCQLFASPSMLEKSLKEFSEYIPRALRSAVEVLGSYPFPRMDLLVAPPSFGSLALTSPNLVVLSGSLVAEDGSLCGRLCHEASHAWFGLAVGAADWAEEWLSEGMATFVEDHLHAHAQQLQPDDARDYMELKAWIRQKTLIDEVSNTEEKLQVLRPDSAGPVVIDGVCAQVVKNGQNPSKNFIQVHYIKGYFLLKHLSDCVGPSSFLKFLRLYVVKYSGKLVTSKEFLSLFLEQFPSFKSMGSVDEICQTWLQESGIPEEILAFKPCCENRLFKEVSSELEKWKKYNSRFCKRRTKRVKFNFDNFISLSPEQLVVLLELLLVEVDFKHPGLDALLQVYHFERRNAEIKHRWLELVVKYRYRSQYPELEKFLTNHMAMGVYLWGELLQSGDTTQEQLARGLYHRLRETMEPGHRDTIDHMMQKSPD